MEDDKQKREKMEQISLSNAEALHLNEYAETKNAPSEDKGQSETNFIHILVVGFHHLKGPIVEFAYPDIPNSKKEKYSKKVDEKIDEMMTEQKRELENCDMEYIQLPQEWNFLPFSALSDGPHQSNTGSSFFSLPPLADTKKEYHQTIFGISKFMQVETEKIINKTNDMSRSFVQKAIVILSKKPSIGIVNEKLSQVTEAYFDQLDFQNVNIFKDFFSSLQNIGGVDISDDILYAGLPLPQFISTFKDRSLTLVKLLLLQKKVLFFGTSMEKVGLYQFALLSLLGDTIRYLTSSGSPEFHDIKLLEDNKQLFNQHDIHKIIHGFNPPLFDEFCVFQPCLTLQQFDDFSSPSGESKTKSFLVGTTNQLFELKSDFYDARVDVDSGDIQFFDPRLEQVLSLTSADLKFVNSVKLAVEAHNSNKVSDESSFIGSDTFVRQKFLVYYQSLAASVLYSQKLKLKAQQDLEFKEEYQGQVTNILDEFNLDFINTWAKTPNFKKLIQFITPDSNFVLDIETLGHPGHGATIFDSIQIKLASQIKNIKLEENLTPVVQSIEKASQRISRAFTGIYHDLQGQTGKSSEGDNMEQQEKNVEQEASTAPASNLISGISSWFQSAKKQVVQQMESWEHHNEEKKGFIKDEQGLKSNVFIKSKYFGEGQSKTDSDKHVEEHKVEPVSQKEKSISQPDENQQEVKQDKQSDGIESKQETKQDKPSEQNELKQVQEQSETVEVKQAPNLNKESKEQDIKQDIKQDAPSNMDPTKKKTTKGKHNKKDSKSINQG